MDIGEAAVKDEEEERGKVSSDGLGSESESEDSSDGDHSGKPSSDAFHSFKLIFYIELKLFDP